MKKSVKLLLPIIALNLQSLFGCQNNKPKKVMLTFGDYNNVIDNFGDYDSPYKYSINSFDEFVEKINKENCLVAVGTSTCQCWDGFAAIAEEYMRETNMICYRVSPSIFDEERDDMSTHGLKVIHGTSAFAIYCNGKAKYSFCSNQHPEVRDYNTFKEFMTSYVDLPKMYYIDEVQFENHIVNPINRSVLYYTKNSCEDCKNVNSLILRPYFESHRDSNPMYVFDCDYLSTAYEGQDYIDKKDDLYLAENSNPNYGYTDGVFPTFMYFDEASPQTGAVAFNDTIEKNGEVYTITNSYYTNERKPHLQYLNNFNGTSVLKGKTLSKQDIEDQVYRYVWKYEEANKFYKPLIYAFLDYSLTKVKNII